MIVDLASEGQWELVGRAVEVVGRAVEA